METAAVYAVILFMSSAFVWAKFKATAKSERKPASAPPPSPRHVFVLLGSISKIKVEAVGQALARVYPECELTIHMLHVASAVPEQPVGLAQTRRGAVHRAQACSRAPALELLRSQPTEVVVYAVGIESGVWKSANNGAWVDGAVVYVERLDDNGDTDSARTAYSDELVLPRKGDDVYVEPLDNGCWSCVDDPHAIVTRGARTRADFLRDAVIRALKLFHE